MDHRSSGNNEGVGFSSSDLLIDAVDHFGWSVKKTESENVRPLGDNW